MVAADRHTVLLNGKSAERLTLARNCPKAQNRPKIARR
jgi:hypothetical protein